MPIDPADVECTPSLRTSTTVKKTRNTMPISNAKRTTIRMDDEDISFMDDEIKEVASDVNAIYEVSSDFDHSSACFEDIMRLREQVCVEQKISPPHFLPNAVIREIARVLPQSMDELARVKGLNEKKISSYGELILSTTKKYV